MISILHHLSPGFSLILPVCDLSPVKQFVHGLNKKKYFFSKFINLFLGRGISGQVIVTVHVGVHGAANKDWAGLGAAEDELSDAPGGCCEDPRPGSCLLCLWRGKQTTDPVTGLLRLTGSSLCPLLHAVFQGHRTA